MVLADIFLNYDNIVLRKVIHSFGNMVTSAQMEQKNTRSQVIRKVVNGLALFKALVRNFLILINVRLHSSHCQMSCYKAN